MIEELFQKQQELINNFFANLEMQDVKLVLQTFLNCPGTIIFTGIGKSGIVAKKIAMTMLSTGTKAFYLSAVDALHGDIGVVGKNDIFVMFSKSGESEELLNLIPSARNKGAFLLGVTCKKQNRLANACDFHMLLPMEEELCPFNMAPTTSAAIQLIFGDVLTTALMKDKKFSLNQYVQNHPSGMIGKNGRRTTLKVKDLMIPEEKTPLCYKEDKLIDCLEELSDKRCGCLIIIDKSKRLEGIFTDGDLRRAMQNKNYDFRQERMENLMTSTPKSTLSRTLVWDAMKQMEEDQKHPIMALPVLEDKKVVGIIKMHDIIQAGF